MSLTVRQLRDRIAGQITETIGPDGWTESTYVFDAFPRDARELGHLAFAVGVTSTVPVPGDRQNTRGGTVARATQALSTVQVRFTFGIEVDDQVEAYADAYDAEATLIATVLAIDGDPDLSLRLNRIGPRGVVGDATYYTSTIEFEVLHRLPLA